jgi:predicted RNase H-like nuclease (RuvC/YqgF family)
LGSLLNVTGFILARLNHPLITALSTCWKGKGDLAKDPRQSHQRSAQATLVALNEFKRYLEVLEKDLSRLSKKYSNREIAQSVGFVAAGIHEALSYLEIVRKVIVKTERAVAKRNRVSENASVSPSPT